MQYLDFSNRPKLKRFLDRVEGPPFLFVAYGGLFYSREAARFRARLQGKRRIGLYVRPDGLACFEAA